MNCVKPIASVFIIWLIISSCRDSNNQTVNITSADVAFNTGFPTHIKCYGSYFDEKYREELVFFADPKSSRCLKTFNLKGELKDSISLSEVLSHRFLIDGINILSRDTIVINSYYPNSIYMLDHKGHVWKTLFLDDLVQWNDSTLDNVEYWSSTQPNSTLGENGTIYLANSFDINLRLEQYDKVSAYKRYFNLEHRLPYFLKLNNVFSDSISTQLVLDDYYRLFSDKYESYSFAIPFYYSTDSLVFLFAQFSDKILYFPHNEPDKMRTFKITSSYSDIGFDPIEISETTIESWADKMNSTTQSNGGISRFFYHPQTQVYSVITTLDKPQAKSMEENYYDRRFSLQILNKEFKKIAEQDYSYQGYDFSGEIPIKDGLLIKKRNITNTPIRYEKIEYSVLRFNR